MTPDDNVEIAKALTTSINAATGLGESIVVERVYQTDWQQDEPRLQLALMPQAETREIETRDNSERITFRVQLALQVGVTPEDRTKSIDRWLGLLSAIKDHVGAAGQMAGATYLSTLHEPLWDQAHLIDFQQFRSAPVFVYRGIRTT